MKVTLLGCGPSQGVPTIGDRWGSCDPTDPRNRRTRPSVVVEDKGSAILVDTSPDLRDQLLANKINRIDAVLYTHLHYDHVAGIGEIRTLGHLAGRMLDLYGTPDVLAGLVERWGYLFDAEKSEDPGLYRPVATARPFAYGDSIDIGGVAVQPFRQDHGICETAGFRFGRFAYSTDAVDLDEAAFAALAGVEVWIVDCLRDRPHPTHAHFERTLDWVARVKPKRAIFTHMNFELDYAATLARCPPGVEPGHDGMVIEID